MQERPNKAVRILGWLVVVFTLVGTFLKINHWPGSNIFLILIPFLYVCFYLPLWFITARQDKQERFFVGMQFGFSIFFVVSQTFRIMHWPLAIPITNLMFWATIFILVPVSLIKLWRFGRTSYFKFNNLVLFIYLVAFMQTSLIRTSETNIGAGSISLSSRQAERAYRTMQAKSIHLYNAFDQISGKEQNNFYKKARLLKQYTDSVERYLHLFKVNIIRQVEDTAGIDPDTLSIADVQRKTEVRTTSLIIVGNDPESPRTGKFSGAELMSVIATYRDSVIKYADPESRAFIASGVNLNTDNGPDEHGDEQNWVSANFFNYPIITVLITLTNLEYEIKNAETQVLTNLLNDALNSASDNVAGKIADLASKLESEKQTRLIENLQKEKELSALKIHSKNQEIAERDNAILWFAVGLSAVCILVFYVIRSNIIRKRINKQLEEQKRTIEEQKKLVDQAFEELHEKNKEVLDSIHYARRIQSALIPTDRYIQRILNRFKEK